MANQIKFLWHNQDSGYASRMDLAVLVDGIVTHIFTLGVENGGTVGSGNHPFEKGQTEVEIWKALGEINAIPEGAVCRCGAREDYHSKSAACYDESFIEEISVEKALQLAVSAKRQAVAENIFTLIWRLFRNKKLSWGQEINSN